MSPGEAQPYSLSLLLGSELWVREVWGPPAEHLLGLGVRGEAAGLLKAA